VKRTENPLLTEAKGGDARDGTSANSPHRRVLRVWLVDDNAALRKLFGQLLTQQPGVRCTRLFPSAESVLATLVEERPPDMIILDVNLGSQSGLSAIRPIKKLAPSVKVVMLTMFSNSHYEAEAFRSGASGFLLKSYRLEEIASLIKEADRNPGNPNLFPNMALYKEAEPDLKKAGANCSGKRFSVLGALRQLCSAPRRQTAG
jgi:DNA-binding NarL/FixJ family response regulator